MISKRIMPAILGASIALTPLIGLAQQEAGAEHASKRGHRMHKMERMLDLTDQQKQQLAAERKSEQARVKPYRDQVEAAHKQLQADVMSGKFDEAKARSILAETAQARTEVALSRARMQAALYNVLTPEQRTKLNERKQKWEQRRAERKQGMQQEKSTTSQ
jgi:protein CpxP